MFSSFFFFKQTTAYEFRISDWSSDVFSSDLRLRGGRSVPKAYAIATEALGRSADFDPAIDSYPRVMVGRLRGLLDRYYADIPWTHRLRVPQGSYEIVVQNRTPPPARTADAPAQEGGDQKSKRLNSNQ